MFRRAVMRAWMLLLVAIGGTGVARAQNFNFSYVSSGVSVMGTFVTTTLGGRPVPDQQHFERDAGDRSDRPPASGNFR